MVLAGAATHKPSNPVDPDITLPAPGAPMILPGPFTMTPAPLPTAAVPAALVPIRLPSRTSPPLSTTPQKLLPEMTLPGPVPGVLVDPPSVLPLAPTLTPLPLLASAAVPAALVPT